MSVASEYISNILNKSIYFNNLDDKPWLILRENHERVQYSFDSVAEFFGNEEALTDGVGVSFLSANKHKPGEELKLGIPLPDSIRPYTGRVISSKIKDGVYQTSICLNIQSELDLINLMRSNDYLNIRHTS